MLGYPNFAEGSHRTNYSKYYAFSVDAQTLHHSVRQQGKHDKEDIEEKLGSPTMLRPIKLL